MVTDYLFMEPLLVERVKTSVSDLKGIFTAPDIAAMDEKNQITPAAHMIYIGDEIAKGTADQGSLGKVQYVTQLWVMVIAVYYADAVYRFRSASLSRTINRRSDAWAVRPDSR
ncbi:MAG: hypothetical protein H7240_12985, partial [Glaciimonas sp.]|nr:hypothetical protein [Glaciimonas sp.]